MVGRHLPRMGSTFLIWEGLAQLGGREGGGVREEAVGEGLQGGEHLG